MTDLSVSSAAVVCADRFYLSDEAQAELARLGGLAWADASDALDLAEKIGGSWAVKVIVSEYVPLNDEVLDRAPGLKGVIAYGAGYNHIDVSAMRHASVQTCNCPGKNSQAVAELVFGLLLSLLRRIPAADPWVRTGGWAETGMTLPGWIYGRELWGKTLGIVGLGHIGVRVAKIAKGFDMKAIGCDPSLDSEQLSSLGVEPVTLSELLSRSDIVTLHVPLVPETEGMIDEAALAAAKPGVILVNTSRGRVIDEDALVRGLRTGHIGGAALDVFASEPLMSSHPLAGFENVILTPHIGALTREAGDRLSDSVARQARDILEGRLPEGLIR
ncbi:MAG TPA: hydroxyacid dehydrogenase [Deltaproteobacteria bacterium]|jgi:phosphoglycerate dehydrogenase-like enzyme|nr:hydroxyacid dehydrogenase [Deltaproteobacteria bacterium]